MRRAILAMLGVVPTVALSADFTVSGTVDVNPPPACVAGVCQSLRAALIAANAAAGADTITLPSGIHQLAIAGAGEDLAATGDLDVLDDVTIIGAGQSVTIIDAAGLDRVFHVLDGALTLNGSPCAGARSPARTAAGSWYSPWKAGSAPTRKARRLSPCSTAPSRTAPRSRCHR